VKASCYCNASWKRSWVAGSLQTTIGDYAIFLGPGFKNFCWVAPARKSALVFFTNRDSGAALYAWLFRQITEQDLSAFYWI
jgi:hypothetical protein